jgi:hypothetical protein
VQGATCQVASCVLDLLRDLQFTIYWVSVIKTACTRASSMHSLFSGHNPQGGLCSSIEHALNPFQFYQSTHRTHGWWSHLWWRRRRGSCSLPCLSHNSLVDSGRLCVMRLPMRPLAIARVVQYGAFLLPRSSASEEHLPTASPSLLLEHKN